jgi:hypothetical protein
LAIIDIPVIDRLAWLPVTVVGTDSSGESVAVAAAIIRARLDQELSPGVFIRYEAAATTTDGVGQVPIYFGSTALLLHYTLDVLPAPNSELASEYGVEVLVGAQLPSLPPIALRRRVAVVGQLLDEHGTALTETTVSASVSDTALCQLSAEALRAAKALAPSQDTTNDRGEFKLWLEPDLADVALTYDIAVEPSIGTWAPRWTFVDQAVAASWGSLRMPPAAHVRAEVRAPGQLLVPETVVSIYEVASGEKRCPQAGGNAFPGRLELRAIGVSDDQGIVRLILPRVDAPAEM